LLPEAVRQTPFSNDADLLVLSDSVAPVANSLPQLSYLGKNDLSGLTTPINFLCQRECPIHNGMSCLQLSDFAGGLESAIIKHSFAQRLFHNIRKSK
jgi:hypothetical protein